MVFDLVPSRSSKVVFVDTKTAQSAKIFFDIFDCRRSAQVMEKIEAVSVPVKHNGRPYYIRQ